MEKVKSGKTTTCKIKFIDSVRFMSSSLSSLSDILAKGLHESKCKVASLILGK